MPELRFDDLVTAGDEQKIIEEIRSIAKIGRLPAGIDLMKLACETRSPRVRNAAAMALLTLGVPNTAELMINLVSRADTKGARGTLLYVLNELKSAVPLDTLVDILINDSYEAQEEAINLLRILRFGERERTDALSRLRPLVRSNDEHLSLLASEAVDLLVHR